MTQDTILFTMLFGIEAMAFVIGIIVIIILVRAMKRGDL